LPLSAREVDSSLTQKGFQKVERDHHFYYLWVAGKKTRIRTMISHGEKEIRDPICSQMAKQMKITIPLFKDFVECKLKQEAYVELLMKNGDIERPQSS
jgi:predicted RNA binding protein YcfA (HicA-like mRNA interferase family)